MKHNYAAAGQKNIMILMLFESKIIKVILFSVSLNLIYPFYGCSDLIFGMIFLTIFGTVVSCFITFAQYKS